MSDQEGHVREYEVPFFNQEGVQSRRNRAWDEEKVLILTEERK